MTLLTNISPDKSIRKEEEKIVNLNFNLQHSLNLIDLSIEYLANVMDEKPIAKKLEKLISAFRNSPSTYLYSKEMLKELLRDHERIIFQLQKTAEYYSQKKSPNSIVDLLRKLVTEHLFIAESLRKSF